MKRASIAVFILGSVILVAILFLNFSPVGKKLKALHLPARSLPVEKNKNSYNFSQKATEAKQFITGQNYQDQYFFLVDLGLPSGQNRFFIYDLVKDSLLHAGLVTHGNCNQYWLEKVKFSNTVGCGCSSLGKYKIGRSYYGRFGLAFKLYGLEQSNSNAYKRYVVLHSHDCVPDFEVEDEICQSNGCPTVSPSFLKKLESMIKKSKKPVLLWIVD